MSAPQFPSDLVPGRGRKLLRALLALFLLAGAGAGLYFGLMTHTPMGTAPRAARPVPPELDAALRCDPSEPLAVSVTPSTDVEGTPVLAGAMRVRRPGQAAAHEVKLWLYPAAGVPAGARAPAIVVSPILGGDHDIERILCKDLTAHGMHALIVDRRLPGEPRLEAFEEALRDMVAARRRAVDWLETRTEVDPRKIAAYGVSLGGMNTTLLAALEPRLAASVIVMAGGDFATVLAGSVEGEAVELRRAYGLISDPPESAVRSFIEKGRAAVTTCPLAFARYIDPRKVLLFTTRRDTSVPTACQERLREALGTPETYTFPTGHYSSIIYLPILTSEARRFLAERFAEAEAKQAKAGGA